MVRNQAGRVVEVSTRVVFGGPRRLVKQLRLWQRGETIQAVFMERWYGTLWVLIAPLRRRARHRGKLWLRVSLYDFMMPIKACGEAACHGPQRWLLV
jgi:hypothetical protein